MPAQTRRRSRPQSRASAALRGLGRLSRSAAFCWARQGLVTAGLGIPVALDLAADRAGRGPQAGDGAGSDHPQNADGPRSGCASRSGSADGGLGFVHGGTIPVHRGFSFASRGARPLRHALPVRFETPTACAAVKFMPSSSSRRILGAASPRTSASSSDIRRR